MISSSTANELGTLGLGEMFDDRILGTDSAHVFMVSAQAIAARSGLIAEVGCGRGALVDLDAPGGAWQDLRGDGRTVSGSTSTRSAPRIRLSMSSGRSARTVSGPLATRRWIWLSVTSSSST